MAKVTALYLRHRVDDFVHRIRYGGRYQNHRAQSEYYGDEREVYKLALQRNREGFSADGKNSLAAVQNVYKILEAFEPAVKGAKIDLSKTFDNQYVEAALKRIK